MNLKDKVQAAYDDIPNSNEKPLYYYCEKKDVQEAVNEFEKEVNRKFENDRDSRFFILNLLDEIFGEWRE